MHILVTNDDGPPSNQSSPYILPFVHALRAAGHTVSVIIPDVQRSWIGKAHIVGQDVQTREYLPPATNPEIHDPEAGGGVHAANGAAGPAAEQPWILVNSTPATCAQLGLSGDIFPSPSSDQPQHFDLVISGPNYGRNTTAVFALSSGTLGAALEAAACNHRAIALSFAFFSRDHDPAIVRECCAHAVKVCEYLAQGDRNGGKVGWGGGRLYSVNVPVQAGVSGRRVVWTRVLQNVWQRGACFQEVADPGAVGAAEGEEVGIRRRESRGDGGKGGGEEDEGRASFKAAVGGSTVDDGVRHFKWAPRFTDVYESVEKAGPGSDGWAVKAGETSVTALRANFMHVDGMEGEVKL